MDTADLSHEAARGVVLEVERELQEQEIQDQHDEITYDMVIAAKEQHGYQH